MVVEDEFSTLEDVANKQDIKEVRQLSEEPQDSTMGWPQEEPAKPGATEQPSVNALPQQLTQDLERGGGAVPEQAGANWQQPHTRVVSTDSHTSGGGVNVADSTLRRPLIWQEFHSKREGSCFDCCESTTVHSP